MNALVTWMEKYLVPVAAKVGQQRHLAALRDSFLAILPATMVGAIAVMINAALGTFPQAIQQAMGHERTFDGNTVPVIKDILAIDNLVCGATLNIIGVLFAMAWGYHLAKSYNVEPFSGAVVSVGTLLAGLNLTDGISLGTLSGGLLTSVQDALSLAEPTIKGVAVAADGTFTASGLNPGNLGATSYFVVMIMGGIAITIYSKLAQTNLKIKLPDTVPPMVSRPFEAIIPAAVAFYVISILYYFVHKFSGSYVIDLIAKYIAAPFTTLSQNIGSVILITALVSILWICGLHGPNVLAGVMDGIWLPLLFDNMKVYGEMTDKSMSAIRAAVESGQLHVWVRNSFDAYAYMGGSGGTFVLLIAILIFSKRDDYRAVAKLGIGPGFFNINEPVLFGMPIVLNPVFAIPFIVAPIIEACIGYFATSLGLVNPMVVQTAWVTPPVMNAWLASGFDPRAALVALICLAVGFIIFLPFVLAANEIKFEGDE